MLTEPMVDEASAVRPEADNTHERIVDASVARENEQTASDIGSHPREQCGAIHESIPIAVTEEMKAEHKSQPNEETGKDQKRSIKQNNPTDRDRQAESINKACDALYGKVVCVRRRKSVEDDTIVCEEGLLRRAQGRSSVKILTGTGEIMIFRVQDVVSIECLEPVDVAQSVSPETASTGCVSVQSVSGAYPKAAAPKQSPSATAKPREKFLLGGLRYELLKAAPATSTGQKAGKGADVAVFYEGRLASNGKMFDKGTMKFKLGKREVIKGFEMGVEGMIVGERRRLHIPAKLGYGASGAAPAIPPNAALIFAIELMQVA